MNEFIIPPIYDEIDDFHNGLAKVRLEEKWGIIDETGKEMIPFIYDEIKYWSRIGYSENGVRMYKCGISGFVDKIDNETSTTDDLVFEDDSVDDFDDDSDYGFFQDISEKLREVRIGDKYGIINIVSGQVIVPIIYNYIWGISKGLAKVKLNDKFGFIDKRGREIIEPIYDNAKTPEKNGLIKVKLKNKCGFIDKNGSVVIPIIYDRIGLFSEGLVMVKLDLDGKWGVIDEKGNNIVPFIYNYIGIFSEGLACVERNGKSGYIDKTGKEVISCIYDNRFKDILDEDFYFHFDFNVKGGKFFRFEDFFKFSSFTDYGIATVLLDDKYIDIDKNGIEVIHDDVKDKKEDIVNNKGKEIVPSTYVKIGEFSKGFVKVIINGKLGIVDENGLTIIPPIYDDIPSVPSHYPLEAGEIFSEGLAKVQLEDKWGFIDKTGCKITPFIYDDLSWFSEGLARFELNDKWGFIDKTGKVVISINYDYVAPLFRNGIVEVSNNDKWGLIDKNGCEVIPLIYDVIIVVSEKLLKVKFQNKWGFISKNGNTF